ncbi:hypothetical protein [Flavobacterium sangjuense]|uniref:Uncharacterized protein n=1 Tax=Flavobacterium sangjuense TaxID=2518177 RepID=A0A4P7PRB7_9FLAO|nr:hypothetical protein [Flavobacterium sangjuense]QBZ97116.1 hypothetical protein GS03_00602 [Flavobacterium sangjuense]
MSATPQNNDNQEIDLSQISKKIGSFFEGISNSIFEGILFIKRNIVIFISLFIIGVGAGYYLDKTSNSYDHEIIVAPNFGSTDYLYGKIDLLESKIKVQDTVFLKSIGIQNPKSLGQIEIEPIIDIYNFVNSATSMANSAQNTQNFELVKLLSEDGDINKVIKEKTTSKNYGRHIIHISTKGLVGNKNFIDPLMAYLNRNEYYQNVQKVYVNNIKTKMKQNEAIILQIDNLLNEFSSTTTNNQKSDKLVYYNENTQLNEIIKTKNNLIGELGGQRMDLVNNEQIIMKNSSVINVKNTKGVNGKMKLVIPLFLFFAFIGINMFKNFYRKQSAKLASK